MVSLQSSRHRQASVHIASLVGVCDGSRLTARRGVYWTRSATRTDNPTTTRLTDNDDNLFSSLLTNGHHVLKRLLPDKTNY